MRASEYKLARCIWLLYYEHVSIVVWDDKNIVNSGQPSSNFRFEIASSK